MKYLFICLSVFYLTGCDTVDYSTPKSSIVVGSLLHRIADTFEVKYKITPSATIIGMPDGIVELLGLDFHMQGPLPKEEIRKFLFRLDKEFLDFVNSDEEIRPYLKKYPFTIENVDITLFFDGNNGILDPEIGAAEIAHGRLTFLTFFIDNEDFLLIKTDNEETYQEALDILSKENLTFQT